MVWVPSPNGDCLIQSAYDMLVSTQNHGATRSWDLAWKLRGPKRFLFFLWLVIHESLLTNSPRMKRHLTDNPMCSKCKSHEEACLYVLRDCTKANDLWHHAVPRERWQTFFNARYEMLLNLHRYETGNLGVSWDIAFGTRIWLFWQ